MVIATDKNCKQIYSQFCKNVVKYTRKNYIGGKKMNRKEKLMEEIKHRGFGCATITTR